MIPKYIMLGSDPKKDPGFDLEQTAEGDSLDECFAKFEQAPALDWLARKGTIIYVAGELEDEDKKALTNLMRTHPHAVRDEAFEMLETQLGRAIESPDDFQDYVGEALDLLGVDPDDVIEWADPDLDDPNCDPDREIYFCDPGRRDSVHTIKWCEDGVIEIDGMILRRSAIYGEGHIKSGILGGEVLEPQEVLGFIVSRILTFGVEGMLGYGRAFGPGKEDKTNATLTPESRRFRSKCVVGTIAATFDTVSKGKHELVKRVVRELMAKNPETPYFLHQQALEIYEGMDAVELFRGTIEHRDDLMYITLQCKSTKHARVDRGAYVLYTDEGDGRITVPVLIGQFGDIGDDGSVYAPLELLGNVKGYLKETVTATVNYKQLTPELRAKYFGQEVLVTEDDRLEPGQTVFTIGDIPHRWNSKADYGIVERVKEVVQADYIQLAVTIRAYFQAELKIRGLGKGLVCPMEAAGIKYRVTNAYGVEDTTPRVILCAPGVIKDAGAAADYLSDIQEVEAEVDFECNFEDYLRLKEKHLPTESNTGLAYKQYGDITLVFDDDTQVITIVDHAAVVAMARISIEASPVAQSVGRSGMTVPQMAWLSSLPSANTWLNKWLLPKIQERIDVLSYLHQVRDMEETQYEDDCPW